MHVSTYYSARYNRNHYYFEQIFSKQGTVYFKKTVWAVMTSTVVYHIQVHTSQQLHS